MASWLLPGVVEMRKPRTPARDYKAERDQLTLHCKLSIGILNGIIEKPDHMSDEQKNFYFGQIAALRAVLKTMGEQE